MGKYLGLFSCCFILSHFQPIHASNESKNDQLMVDEQICISNPYEKPSLPEVCVLRLKGITYTPFSSKDRLSNYLNQMGVSWTLVAVTDAVYQNLLEGFSASPSSQTSSFAWHKKLEKGRIASCIFKVTQSFVEGGIPFAIAGGASGSAFGAIVGAGVGAAAVVLAAGGTGAAACSAGLIAGIMVCGAAAASTAIPTAAPVGAVVGATIGGAIGGTIVTIGAFFAGGTVKTSDFLKNDHGKVCGSFHSYSLIPLN